jgi:RNA polymerase sigma factor (sigma-70 family)
MEKDWTLTPANFDALLAWLHPERERAALKYEQIRLRMIRIFICRGSAIAEELADRTFDRVMRKLPDFVGYYSGDPALYFYGVAKNIFRESLRDETTNVLPSPKQSPTEDDAVEYDCLDKCMDELPPESRRLVLSYYEETRQKKIDSRKRLAEELGIDLNALRIRVHRLRVRLEECVRHCVNGRQAQAK